MVRAHLLPMSVNTSARGKRVRSCTSRLPTPGTSCSSFESSRGSSRCILTSRPGSRASSSCCSAAAWHQARGHEGKSRGSVALVVTCSLLITSASDRLPCAAVRSMIDSALRPSIGLDCEGLDCDLKS